MNAAFHLAAGLVLIALAIMVARQNISVLIQIALLSLAAVFLVPLMYLALHDDWNIWVARKDRARRE